MTDEASPEETVGRENSAQQHEDVKGFTTREKSPPWSWSLRSFWIVGCFGALYAFATRGATHLLYLVASILILGLFVLIAEAGIYTPKEKAKAFRERPIRFMMGIPAGALLFGTIASPVVLLLYGWVVFGMDVLNWLRYQSVAAIVVGTGVAGAVFFWIRLRFRVLYGASEACVGLFIAWYQASRYASSGLPVQVQFYLAVLTAGIYLVVRGLDNVHQGWRSGSDLLVLAVHRRVVQAEAKAARSETAK